MQTLLNDTELEFKDTVTRLATSVGIANPGDLEFVDHDDVWKRLAGAGLLELRTRDAGAPVASGIEVLIASEALGAALVPAPYIGTGVMAVELLELAQADAALIAEIASGGRRTAILLTSDMGSLAALQAGAPAVLFDTDGAEDALALTDEPEPHLVRIPLPKRKEGVGKAVDLTRTVAPVELADVANAEVLGSPLSGEALDRWQALALVAVAADAVGLMRALLALTVEYSKERSAFGTHIGTFQSLQHLCAETHVSIEATYTLTKYAAFAVDGLDAPDALRSARVAKGYASASVRTAAENCTQVFGGIGHTWDHIAHFYLRRGLLDRQVLGDDKFQFTTLGAEAIADFRATE